MAPRSGRPRGTGRVQVIPPVELTAREHWPFDAGYRIAQGVDVTASADAPPMDYFHVRTTAAERRMLATLPSEHVDMWIMIGAMQAWLEAAISRARAA